MRSLRTLLVLVTALASIALASACSESTSADSGPGADGQTGGEDAGQVDLPDGGGTVDPADIVDAKQVPEDVPMVEETFQREDVPLVEGGFGWPCEQNGECDSGYCVPTDDGSVCTQGCYENCPAGWSCKRSPFSVDEIYICVPLFIHICDPCEQNSDCTGGVEGIDDRCLDFGDAGKYCGGDCSSSGLCPPGYNCEVIEGEVRQCMPESGTCECSPRATRLELRTTCYMRNEHGVCVGERYCAPNGLSDCDAATPAQEICDGRDNDCSGVADDFQAPQVCENANQHGSCKGEERCVGGVALCDGPEAEPEVCDGIDNDCDADTDEGYVDSDADGYKDCIDTDDDNDGIDDETDICPANPDPEQENYDGDELGDACDDDDDNDGVNDADDCAPFDATIKPGIQEICDFKDNDCDGETDEGICEDGNPCTDDICDPVLGCSNIPNNLPCDDGNVCTLNDTCIEGVCNPGQPINCDDGNPCTGDFCNPSTGCYSQNLEDTPCEDGNFCTDNDVCSNGICRSGPVKTCNDDNGCTLDSCDPASGCVYDPNALTGSPCDDGDRCQSGDVCGGGQCTAGPISYCAQEENCPDGIYLGTCVDIGIFPLCVGGCFGEGQ